MLPEGRSRAMSKLTGKGAVVTDASKRIGAEIARRLAGERAAVVVVVVNYAGTSSPTSPGCTHSTN
jgi:hypothetical protein